MLVVFVVTIGAMIFQRSTAVPLFQARARVAIEQEQRQAAMRGVPVPLILAEFMDRNKYLKGQYLVLRSRDIAEKVVKTLQLDEPPAAFAARIGVEPIPGTQLVDVTFTSPDRSFAVSAANTVAETYVQNNLDLRFESRRKMLEWLDGQLAEQMAKLKASDRALAEYREQHHAQSLDEKQNLLRPQFTKATEDANRAAAQRYQKEVLYNRARALTPEAAAQVASIAAQNPTLASLNGDLAGLEQQRVQLAQRYGAKHPTLQAMDGEIDEARKRRDAEYAKTLESLKHDYDAAVREERAVAAQLGAVKSDVVSSEKKGVRYSVLEAEAKTTQDLYDSLLEQANALRVLNNSRANNVRIVDRADLPKAPLPSSQPYGWLLSIITGVVLAVSVAFGLDYMDDTLKTPDDIVRRLRLPVLGIVPKIREEESISLVSKKTPEEFGEAFRSIRTTLMVARAHGATVLTVTSTQPQEGKTTTACNVAMALALSDARVLLIDADMRRPRLHKAMRLTNDRGLSHVLHGNCRVRDAVQKTAHSNLLAMTAGATSANAADLLTSERMKALLEQLKNGPFDWVIVDTPPVLAATDAVSLAPLTSGVLFVVGSELTRRRAAEHAVNTLRTGQPNFVGVVLNKVDVVRNSYYYSRNYGNAYKNHYAA